MFGLAAVCVALVLALLVLHRELLRRAFLRAEDPRTLGALRIGFTLCMIAEVLEIVDDARWLFSDEGMFLAAGAREFMAGDALAGFQAGGFVDAAALWHYLGSSVPTPLHFRDSPDVVYACFAGLLLALVGLLLGCCTRVCAWVALALYLGLLRRNNLWTGGEQVFCSGLFLLAAARCGHAYSLDNWSRCRALRRRGLLSLPAGPGGGAGVAPGPQHPRGLAAIYRRIPAWPRLLLIAQVAVAYGANGLNKTGHQWWDGTAIYYVLHSDWARFDWRALALWLGTDVTAWMTWFVRAWETLFPLVVVGLVIRFAAREGLPPPRGARWLWLALGVAGVALVATIAPLHPRVRDPERDARAWALGGAVVVLASWWLYPRLRGGLRLGRWEIDRDTIGRWLLGRRVWWTGGLLFTLGVVTTLNVGVFPLATLVLCLALLRGEEVAALLARGRPVIACEDPALPHLYHDDAALPPAVLVGVAAVLLGGLLVPGLPLRWVVLTTAALGIVAAMRTSRHVQKDMSLGPWSYGPVGRLLAGSLCAVHLAALAACAVPRWPALDELRAACRRPTAWWLGITGTRQSWGMFASVHERNESLTTLVIDAAGREHDLHSDLYRPDMLPALWLWRRPQTKLDFHIMADEKLATWHARAVCRGFAREHAGVTPREVTLISNEAPIAGPWDDTPTDRLARFAADVRRTSMQTVVCASEPHGQLPADLRDRLGLPASQSAFVPTLRSAEDRWPRVRGEQGPLWPYDEWVAVLVIGGLLLRWRAHMRRR